jgi:hypothetical protein
MLPPSPWFLAWIYRGQSGTGATVLRVLRFPMPIPIPTAETRAIIIIPAWYNRPHCSRRIKWPLAQPTLRIKTNIDKNIICLSGCDTVQFGRYVPTHIGMYLNFTASYPEDGGNTFA